MTAARRTDGDIERALARAGLPPLPRTAWLAVDLDRLAGNLAAIRGSLPRGTVIRAVVKADAYGHGAVPVARALASAGAEAFGVATLDEALELRAGGVAAPILILYPIPPASAPLAAAARVAVTLGDADLAERTLAAVAPDGDPPLEVHVEVETGLGRGGLPPGHALDVARRVAAHPGLRLLGAWSHLGAAADPVRSHGQDEVLAEFRHLLDDADIGVGQWHLAASGGLLADSARPYDAVRVGLALYGLVPDGLDVADARASHAAMLAPVLSLHARPVRVIDLPPGAAISYGDGFVTARRSRIATLPVGYADGYRRALSNRSTALVRGVRVPLVGSIAMDAVMVDVTDVPGAPVTIDDVFVLIGDQGDERIGALDVALLGTTISWEVLAGMARRLPRVYYAGAVPVGLRTLTESGHW